MLLDFNTLKQKHDLDIKGVIHIGGHHGQEFKTYEENNIKNVMFFEPVPNTFEVLKKNIGDKAILHNLALGNENKKIEMFIETANQGQSSSILEPKVHLTEHPEVTFPEKETITVKRFDNFVRSNNIDVLGYNMLNVDVQGYELEVFKGFGDYLNQIDIIIAEVNRDEVYKGCAMIGDIDAYLSQYNLRQASVYWQSASWGDAVYVRT